MREMEKKWKKNWKEKVFQEERELVCAGFRWTPLDQWQEHTDPQARS